MPKQEGATAGTGNASTYIDKVVRCRRCMKWVERIQPNPGSQGTATWRHVLPTDHVAEPLEAQEKPKAVES